MQFARRVGLDLFRFLEGFATQGAGDTILIPTNILDRWVAHCCCALPRSGCARTQQQCTATLWLCQSMNPRQHAAETTSKHADWCCGMPVYVASPLLLLVVGCCCPGGCNALSGCSGWTQIS